MVEIGTRTAAGERGGEEAGGGGDSKGERVASEHLGVKKQREIGRVERKQVKKVKESKSLRGCYPRVSAL